MILPAGTKRSIRVLGTAIRAQMPKGTQPITVTDADNTVHRCWDCEIRGPSRLVSKVRSETVTDVRQETDAELELID